MKTAMGIVIEKIKESKEVSLELFKHLTPILSKGIDQEKAQLIEAYRKGHVDGYLEVTIENDPEKYYKETFKQP